MRIQTSQLDRKIKRPPGHLQILKQMLKSVARHGLLSPAEARRKGIALFTSATPMNKWDCVDGRGLGPFSANKYFAEDLDDVLSAPLCGILNVMAERPRSDPAAISYCPDYLGGGIIFVCDAANIAHKITTSFDVRREINVKGRVEIGEISRILVPHNFFRAAKETFTERTLINITESRPTSLGGQIVSLPDFATAITDICRQTPNTYFWLHGMRLPLAAEIHQLDPHGAVDNYYPFVQLG